MCSNTVFELQVFEQYVPADGSAQADLFRRAAVSTPAVRRGAAGPRWRSEVAWGSATSGRHRRCPPSSRQHTRSSSTRDPCQPLGRVTVTRLYGDAVNDAVDDVAEVRRHDDQPEQFLWRGRLYLIQAVLDHWIESGGWWQAARPAAPAGTFPGSPLDDGEREFWRVEAGFGRLGGTGVFDLCFDWSPGRWTIVRVQD